MIWKNSILVIKKVCRRLQFFHILALQGCIHSLHPTFLPNFAEGLKSRSLFQSEVMLQQHFHCSASTSDQPSYQTSLSQFFLYLPAAFVVINAVSIILLHYYCHSHLTRFFSFLSLLPAPFASSSPTVTTLVLSLKVMPPKVHIQLSKSLPFPGISFAWHSLSGLPVSREFLSDQHSLFLQAIHSTSSPVLPPLSHEMMQYCMPLIAAFMSGSPVLSKFGTL